MDKKTIIKKCMGQGGLVKDTIKEIPGTIVRGIKGIKNFAKGQLKGYFKKKDEWEAWKVAKNKEMIEGD